MESYCSGESQGLQQESVEIDDHWSSQAVLYEQSAAMKATNQRWCGNECNKERNRENCSPATKGNFTSAAKECIQEFASNRPLSKAHRSDENIKNQNQSPKPKAKQRESILSLHIPKGDILSQFTLWAACETSHGITGNNCATGISILTFREFD